MATLRARIGGVDSPQGSDLSVCPCVAPTAMDGVPFTIHPRFEGRTCGSLVSRAGGRDRGAQSLGQDGGVWWVSLGRRGRGPSLEGVGGPG